MCVYRTHKDTSIHAFIQQRLQAVFSSATDALVFLAKGSGESFSRHELLSGLARLGITGVCNEDLSGVFTSDDDVNFIEFLRLYAWDDVEFVNADVHDAILRRNKVCACVCVCMYTHTHIHIHAHIYIYICIVLTAEPARSLSISVGLFYCHSPCNSKRDLL